MPYTELPMKHQTLQPFLLIIYGVMCCGLRRAGAKQHERGVCEAPAGVVLFEGKALHIMYQVHDQCPIIKR